MTKILGKQLTTDFGCKSYVSDKLFFNQDFVSLKIRNSATVGKKQMLLGHYMQI